MLYLIIMNIPLGIDNQHTINTFATESDVSLAALCKIIYYLFNQEIP